MMEDLELNRASFLDDAEWMLCQIDWITPLISLVGDLLGELTIMAAPNGTEGVLSRALTREGIEMYNISYVWPQPYYCFDVKPEHAERTLQIIESICLAGHY